MSETSAEKNVGGLALHDGDATSPWQDLSAVLTLGDRARTENDASRAYAFYTRATELDPKSSRAWIGRAATSPNLDDAIKNWVCVLSLGPTDAEAKGALEKCVGERILQSRPEDADALVNSGRSLAEAGQKELSHRLLVRATELDDTREEAWIWRAGVAEDSREAVSCLNQALALNPGNTQAQAGLQWAMGLHADASKPRDSKASEQAARLVEQAQQLLLSEDRERAHDLLRRATELDSTNESAWLWRGSTTTDIDEALTCMEQALAIDPQNESAREARSWLRVKKLREGVKPSRPVEPALQPKPAQSAPAKRSGFDAVFLLVTPILIILLGLAILIWKLIL